MESEHTLDSFRNLKDVAPVGPGLGAFPVFGSICDAFKDKHYAGQRLRCGGVLYDAFDSLCVRCPCM